MEIILLIAALLCAAASVAAALPPSRCLRPPAARGGPDWRELTPSHLHTLFARAAPPPPRL